MSIKPGSLLRQPLVHFLLLGALIGGMHLWLGGEAGQTSNHVIRITEADIDRMAVQWQARWNRPPTEQELDGLIKAKVHDTALYREALAMGLAEDDPAVRRVLVQKLEGMARDLIELSLSPTEQDLQEYYTQNAERYRPEPLITFVHVFLDPDRRGAATPHDAGRILAELRRLDRPLEQAERFGDRFMLENYHPNKSEREIASLFGSEFARAVFELEPGRWDGPVRSGYGTHLVYVEERREFPVPALDEVRDSITRDWVEDKRREITDRYFAELQGRYEVIVERNPSRESAASSSTPAP